MAINVYQELTKLWNSLENWFSFASWKCAVESFLAKIIYASVLHKPNTLEWKFKQCGNIGTSVRPCLSQVWLRMVRYNTRPGYLVLVVVLAIMLLVNEPLTVDGDMYISRHRQKPHTTPLLRLPRES